MSRRSGGGVKSSFDRTLLHDIESLKKKNSYTTIPELVNHLRATYPCYARQKVPPFTKYVSRIVNKTKVDCDDENMKKRKSDALNNSSGSTSTIASVAGSGSSSDADELSEDEASMSDAVYGKKLKPEFDLMQSMLRDNYIQKVKEVRVQGDVQKAIEWEVLENVDDKKTRSVNNVNKQVGVEGDELNKINVSGRHITKVSEAMFKNIGGMSEVIEELKMLVIVPLRNPRLLLHLGVSPAGGILLHGPPGCGKTMLAHAIANEAKVPFYQIYATELVSGVSGASEENIRELFSKAHRTAPSIVFIDEIDAIASKRDSSQRAMEQRIVTQLLACMDESHRQVNPSGKSKPVERPDCSRGHVLVIGATNRPDSIDPALRRPGRFDQEFFLGVPDEHARLEILSVLTRSRRVEGALDMVKIARSTSGFVGADLKSIVDKAGNNAMRRTTLDRKVQICKVRGEHCGDWYMEPFSKEEIEKTSIIMSDFEEAVKTVQPSTKREGFSTVPDVKWDDVGGYHFLRQEFESIIVEPIKYPEDFEGYDMGSDSGFLLYGPPGCGKTLIAQAVANEAGANFIYVKGPELLNKYVGESELAVRTIFRRARTCSPCIIFLDEIDALTTRRGNEGGWVVERLLTQFLIELDGVEKRKGVFVIGATNRPEIVDPALLRPGRLGNRLYVPLPSPEDRGMILKALACKKPIHSSVDLIAIGRDNACSNFSGADLSDLMNKAYRIAREDKRASACTTSDGAIKDVHFKRALEKMSPSVLEKEIQNYERLAKRMKNGRG